MKKILLIALFPLAVSAQRGGGNNDGPRFGWAGDANGNGIPALYGFSVGISSASVSVSGGTMPPGGEPRTGISVNAFLAIPVSQRFFIRPEFGYAAMGSRKSASGFIYDADYFLMPILGSFELNPNRSIRILIGPQLGYLLSASQSVSGVKTNVRDQVSIRDFSIAGGVEWLPNRFGLSLRGQYGFSDAAPGASIVRNRMIAANIVFRLSK
ncbi:MAG: outer membrane beta-barrel protein [Bacteroidota bacterium]